MSGLNKIAYERANKIILIALAIICFIYAAYVSFYYANQLPLDIHKFRQTQTALTAFWLKKNGFSFSYETPVAGPPWSIPFEFPIYQYLVALISQFFSFSLQAIGRVLSFIFLALCVLPARSITRSLNLSKEVFYIFTALLFSTPLYLYWGRTFMIETAALFFIITTIKYFIDVTKNTLSLKAILFTVFFMSLALLQKSTTALPVMFVLGSIYMYRSIKDSNSVRSFFLSRNMIVGIVIFILPLLVGGAWSLYAEGIKRLNSYGVQLTTSSLHHWIFGTLAQRTSFLLYHSVVWERVLWHNLAGELSIAIVMMALLLNRKKLINFFIGISLLLGLLPFFIFTNLHIKHEYYQVATVAFLLYAVAISLGEVLNNCFDKKIIVCLLLMLLLASNFYWFRSLYLPRMKIAYSSSNAWEIAISNVIREKLLSDETYILFGNDWSSTVAYLSERKSFTVPKKYSKYNSILVAPEEFVPKGTLGAIVLCQNIDSPTLDALRIWQSSKQGWEIEKIGDCYMASRRDEKP